MLRREFLKPVLGSAPLLLISRSALTAQGKIVPWSSGTELPRDKAPALCTDCHHHIYDSRFPVDPKAQLRPGDATVRDYRLLQERIGIKRHVVVQPSTYGVDNRCLVDALQQFGRGEARGIAVVNSQVGDDELKRLDAAGVCGIRFNLSQAGATTLDMIAKLAPRVARLNWHIQINMSAEQIAAAGGLWKGLPCALVFDHLAHVREPAEAAPGYAVIRSLLASGKAWVKLSGAYIDSTSGAPAYADRTAIARAYVKEAPEHMVWGSDWPHPSVKDKPDDAVLFDLLSEWIPDARTRRRVLVENAAKLYGFA